MKHISIMAASLALAFAAPAFAQHHHEGELQIPSSLKAEHSKIHHELEAVIAIGGRTGEAAEEVAEALHQHFESEEEFAMPQLGLLQAAAAGEYPAGAQHAIELSTKLRNELPKMLAEHQAIVKKLDALTQVAKAQHQPKALEFAEALRLHAENEEQVLYPAAILVGEQLARNQK